MADPDTTTPHSGAPTLDTHDIRNGYRVGPGGEVIPIDRLGYDIPKGIAKPKEQAETPMLDAMAELRRYISDAVAHAENRHAINRSEWWRGHLDTMRELLAKIDTLPGPERDAAVAATLSRLSGPAADAAGRTRAHLPPLGHDESDKTGWSKISRAAREASGLDQDALAEIYNDWIARLPEDQSNPHQFKSFLAGVALVQNTTLSTRPAAAGGDPTPAVDGVALPGVEALRAFSEAATPGRWHGGHRCDGAITVGPLGDRVGIGSDIPAADAMFAAEAVNFVRARLATPEAPAGDDAPCSFVQHHAPDGSWHCQSVETGRVVETKRDGPFVGIPDYRRARLAEPRPDVAGLVDAPSAGRAVREAAEAVITPMVRHVLAERDAARDLGATVGVSIARLRALNAALASSAPAVGVELLSPREIAERIVLDVLDDEQPDRVVVFTNYRLEIDRAEGPIRAALDAGSGGAAAGDGWRKPEEQPYLGRKVIALFDDGSGALMLWIYDGGMIDSDGDERGAWPPSNCDRWSYLPDELEFHCELWAEDPIVLTLPAPPITSTTTGTEGRDHG